MPIWYLVCMAAAFGACFGSFFNVVVWRIPRGESVVSPPSRCPNCETMIPWYRNLPIITWLVQRGKCAWCGCSISPRYLALEIFCAVLCGAWAWDFFGNAAEWRTPGRGLAWLLCAMIAVPVAIIDWKHFEIPDGLMVTLGVGSILLRTFFPGDYHWTVSLKEAIRDSCMAAGLLYGLSFGSRVFVGWLGDFARYLLSRPSRNLRKGRLKRDFFSLLLRWARFTSDTEALGLGDVTLGLAAGAALGAWSVLLGLFTAAILAFPGYFLRGLSPASRESALEAGVHPSSVPFGPFLCIGFLLVARILLGYSPDFPGLG